MYITTKQIIIITLMSVCLWSYFYEDTTYPPPDKVIPQPGQIIILQEYIIPPPPPPVHPYYAIEHPILENINLEG